MFCQSQMRLSLIIVVQNAVTPDKTAQMSLRCCTFSELGDLHIYGVHDIIVLSLGRHSRDKLLGRPFG